MRQFDGYPDSFGAKRVSTVGHAGPSTYVPYTEGVAPALSTGGDTVQAREGGLTLLDGVIPFGMSDSGKYYVQVLQDSVSGIVATPGYIPRPATTVRLRWMVAATGVEAGAVDLSAEIVRLFMVGPK